MGLDQAGELPRRDDGHHLAQDALTLRLIMMSVKTDASESHLTHDILADRLDQIRRDLPRSAD